MKDLKSWVWMLMFDHTVIIAEDDPFLQEFIKLNENKIIQLRIIPYVGAEGFAEIYLQ